MERIIRQTEFTRVLAWGGTGKGGENLEYIVAVDNNETQSIKFQNGPIPEAGVNGVTNEDLIAVVIDRLKLFQEGPFPCQENANALRCLLEAEHWLDRRMASRKFRGVEGKYEK